MEKKDLYKSIDETTLRNAINNAKLQLYKEAKGVSINEWNVLFGSTDYRPHPNTIEEAKRLLAERLNEMTLFDLKQNLNYYKDGKMFDIILFQGYRGAYDFFIGWQDGGEIKEHYSEFFTMASLAMF